MRPSLRPCALIRSLIVATALLAIAAPRLTAECTPYWVPSQEVSMGDVGKLATADFNADGVADFALTTHSITWVAVTDAVTRQIGTPAMIGSRSGMIDVIARDFTGDGVVDVVSLSSVAKVIDTHVGHGDGTFGEAIYTVTPAAPGRFEEGDFNGDSKLDLAVLALDGMSLSIWIGNGAGQFSSATSVGLTSSVTDVAVADFTGDGKQDVLGASATAGLLLFAGKGDGTLETAASAAAGTFNRLVAADLDDDADFDVVATGDGTATMSVHLNSGGGTFAAAAPYSTLFQSGHTGRARSISIGDITPDGQPDVVLTLDDDWLLATFVATGGGTFAAADFRPATQPMTSVLADLDGDGRNDLVYRNSAVSVALNNCGDVTLTAQATTPIVSVGDHLRVTATLSNGINDAPAGDIDILEGSTVLASGLATTVAPPEIELPLLPAGTHTLKALFAGNFAFHPAESPTFTATVTEETTTTTVSVVNPTNDPIQFGDRIDLGVAVTSTIPGTPEGAVQISIDGVKQNPQNCCPFLWYDATVGDHSVSAEYLGSATHPPSRSEPISVRVTKAQSSVQLFVDPSSSAGTQTTIYVSPGKAGRITLLDGGTVLFTRDADAGEMVPYTTTFALGTHRLVARYSETAEYLAAEATAEHTVVPAGTISIEAHADGGSVHLLWRSTHPELGFYELRRLVGGVWQMVSSGGLHAGQNSWGFFWFNDVSPGEAYIYQMLGWDFDHNPIPPSNIDAATFGTFIDAALTPGVTPVRSRHLTDVLDAVNRLRSALAATPLSMPALAAGNVVTYQHLLDLRSRTNEARTALGMPAYPFTDRGASRTILVRDLEELRSAVQ